MVKVRADRDIQHAQVSCACSKAGSSHLGQWNCWSAGGLWLWREGCSAAPNPIPTPGWGSGTGGASIYDLEKRPALLPLAVAAAPTIHPPLACRSTIIWASSGSGGPGAWQALDRGLLRTLQVVEELLITPCHRTRRAWTIWGLFAQALSAPPRH